MCLKDYKQYVFLLCRSHQRFLAKPKKKNGANAAGLISILALIAAITDLFVVIIIVMLTVLSLLSSCENLPEGSCQERAWGAVALLFSDVVVLIHMIFSFVSAVRLRECHDTLKASASS